MASFNSYDLQFTPMSSISSITKHHYSSGEQRNTTLYKNNDTNYKFSWKIAFIMCTKRVNLCLKAENQLRIKNNTEDWELGLHLRDNDHVTH